MTALQLRNHAITPPSFSHLFPSFLFFPSHFPAHSNHSLKSRTIDDNLNPVWGGSTDIFCFAYQPAVAPGDLAGGAGAERRREICVEMYDEDPTYDGELPSPSVPQSHL